MVRQNIPSGLTMHEERATGTLPVALRRTRPAAEVARLLKEKPKAKGLTAPGMPVGAPGMEQGDKQQPYDVSLGQRRRQYERVCALSEVVAMLAARSKIPMPMPAYNCIGVLCCTDEKCSALCR